MSLLNFQRFSSLFSNVHDLQQIISNRPYITLLMLLILLLFIILFFYNNIKKIKEPQHKKFGKLARDLCGTVKVNIT